jgi:hypothetical protein
MFYNALIYWNQESKITSQEVLQNLRFMLFLRESQNYNSVMI